MNIRPSIKGRTRAEQRVISDLGWLAFVSLAIVVLIVVKIIGLFQIHWYKMALPGGFVAGAHEYRKIRAT
jgi:hypothetical protein